MAKERTNELPPPEWRGDPSATAMLLFEEIGNGTNALYINAQGTVKDLSRLVELLGLTHYVVRLHNSEGPDRVVRVPYSCESKQWSGSSASPFTLE